MAENDGATFKVRADTTPAEGALESFAGRVGLAVTGINQALELTDKVIRGIGKAFDFAMRAEEIAAVSKRFESLAEQAGLIPEKISQGIEKAIGGTVQLDDAMRVAQKSLVELGTNADKIPALFDLARKAAMLFGGSTTEIFQDLSQAVATGSTRALRNIGLVIDSQKAYEVYADRVGTVADRLSEAQKQQALMNAVLERGNQKFADINGSITPIAEAFRIAKVAASEFMDTISKVFNKVFGGIFKSMLDNVSSSLTELKRQFEVTFLGSAFSATEQIAKLNVELARLQQMAVTNPSIQPSIDNLMRKIESLQLLEMQEAATASATASANINKAASYDALANATSEASLELIKLREAQGEWEEKMKKMQQQAEMLGAVVKNAFANAISKSIQFMVKNLMDGKNAFTGFIAMVGNLMGELAIQLGTMFIAVGIAMIALEGLSGLQAIAAGAGLVAVGTILKALSGGGGDFGGAGSSPANPSYTSDASGFGSTMNTEEERAKPQTGVTVVVQGNIFDNRETGLQIANIINDAFDTNGTIIRAGA